MIQHKQKKYPPCPSRVEKLGKWIERTVVDRVRAHFTIITSETFSSSPQPWHTPAIALPVPPIRQKGMHKQLKKFAVFRRKQVNQFMHNHELSHVFGHGQEHGVERQLA